MLQHPTSGYGLKQQLDADFPHCWSADLPQIYRTLNRMEREGLVEATPEESARGPDRKLNTPTPRGQAELERWLLGTPEGGPMRDAALVQVAHLHLLPDPEAWLRVLRDHRAVLEGELRELQERARDWAAADPSYPDCRDDAAFCLQLTLDARIQELQARVAWASRCIHRIEARLRLSGRVR